MFKKLFTLTIIALIFVSIKSNIQEESLEELNLIEREEFGTVSYNLTPENLSFLAGSGDPAPTPTPTPTPTPSGSGIPAVNSFDKLLDGIFKSTNTYARLVETFKTKRTSSIDQVLEGKGFSDFSATGVVKMTKGIKASRFSDYIKLLKKIIKVPAEHTESIDAVLETIEFAEKDFWNNYKNAFSVGQQSQAKFVSIYAYANLDAETYDIVYLNVEGTFKLAPDTIVIKKTLMVLGGIWNDDKIEYEKRDKSITPEVMDQVFNFFSILSFHSIGKMLGVNFEFPKF
jgi:hypothetical protein